MLKGILVSKWNKIKQKKGNFTVNKKKDKSTVNKRKDNTFQVKISRRNKMSKFNFSRSPLKKQNLIHLFNKKMSKLQSLFLLKTNLKVYSKDDLSFRFMIQ